MTELLTRILKHARQDYLGHRINSERSFQANLHHHFRTAVGEEPVLTEASVYTTPPAAPRGRRKLGCCDLVVCRRNVVQAFIEIKVAPQWLLARAPLLHDMKKLVRYATQIGNIVHFDRFGPDHKFEKQRKLWDRPMPRYRVTTATRFIFAVIALSTDRACQRDQLIALHAPLRRVRNFTVLSLAINPDRAAARHCVASLQ